MVGYKDIKDKAIAWATEYKNSVNNNAAYARNAKKWGVGFDGAMTFVFQAQGEITEDFSIFLDLKEGKCLDTKVFGPGEKGPREAPMVIAAPMANWKDVIFKTVDPVTALMQGKLKLKGDMSLVMRFAQAAIELVNSTEKTDRSLFTQYNLGEAAAAPAKEGPKPTKEPVNPAKKAAKKSAKKAAKK